MFVSPTVVGDAVLIASCAGSAYALERTTGAPVWRYDANADGSAAQFHGEPLLLGERVVIPTDGDPKGHLYSFDRESGAPLWKIPSDRGFATTPMLVDDRIVAVTARGEVVAIDPEKGSVIWRKAPAGVLEPIPFIQSPAYAGKRIFVADNTGGIFALDVATGATLWQKTLEARVNTSLVVIGNKVVVGTSDGSIHWLATESGATLKRMHLEEGLPYGTPIFASPFLFVLTAGETGNLLALDEESGALQWKRETDDEWTTYRPLLQGSTIIAGNSEKNLCAFDRASGEVQWCRSIGQVPRGLGVSRDGFLYVGSLSGLVQAFRLGGPTAPRPSVEED